MSGIRDTGVGFDRDVWWLVCRRCRVARWVARRDPWGNRRVTCINGHDDDGEINSVLG